MPQTPPTTTQAMLRFMRIVHGMLIVSILLYVPICWQVVVSNPEPVAKSFVESLGLLSLGVIAAGFYLRSKWIGAAYETLRVKPDDPSALALWRKGGIVSAALGESVVLYGLAIYLIGGNVKQAAPFFVIGLFVMLMWWPKQP